MHYSLFASALQPFLSLSLFLISVLVTSWACVPKKKVSDSTYTWRADGFARMRAAHGYRFSALRSSSSSSVYSESPHSLSRVSGSSTVSDVDAIAEATVASGALTRGGRGRHKNALTLVAELLEQHVAEQQSLSPEHETTAQATLKREHHVEVDDVSKEWFVVVQAGDDDGESRAAKSEAKAIAKAEAKAAAKAATRAAGLGVHGHDYRRSRLDQSTTSKEQEIEVRVKEFSSIQCARLLMTEILKERNHD